MDKNESYPSTSYIPSLIPTSDFRTFAGVIVASYLDSYTSFTHELCHSIGAVDLYNRAALYEEENHSNDTYIGSKCLMGNGDSQLCLFQKLKLGFVEEHDIVVVETQSLKLEIIGMSEDSFGYRGARFNRRNDSCYYLVEARTGTGIEEESPSGVLVTLVDESKRPGYGIVDIAQYDSHIQNDLLQVGQNLIDEENDFAVQVLCRTEVGFNISFLRDIEYGINSFDVNLNWTGSNYGIELSECIDGTVYSISQRSNYTGNAHYYYEISGSLNYGLNWNVMLSQSNSNYNTTEAIICNVNKSPVFIGYRWNSNISELFLMYNDKGWRTESLRNISYLHKLDAVSDGERVYICWGYLDRGQEREMIGTGRGIWNGTLFQENPQVIENHDYPVLTKLANGSSHQPLIIAKRYPMSMTVDVYTFTGGVRLQSLGFGTGYEANVTSFNAAWVGTQLIVTTVERTYDGDYHWNTRCYAGTSPRDLQSVGYFLNCFGAEIVTFQDAASLAYGLFLTDSVNKSKTFFLLKNRAWEELGSFDWSGENVISPYTSGPVSSIIILKAHSYEIHRYAITSTTRQSVTSRVNVIQGTFNQYPGAQYILIVFVSIIVFSIIFFKRQKLHPRIKTLQINKRYAIASISGIFAGVTVWSIQFQGGCIQFINTNMYFHSLLLIQMTIRTFIFIISPLIGLMLITNLLILFYGDIKTTLNEVNRRVKDYLQTRRDLRSTD
jgi:hypothetical protein